MIVSVNHRKHTFKLSMLAVANTASKSPHPPTAKDCNPVSYADHAEEKREKRERERERERKLK